LTLAILTQPVQARQAEQAHIKFDCVTTKVIITDTAGHRDSVRAEERLTFYIDDAAKTFIFSDGRRLRVTRFDKSWIGANDEDIQYEFNRTDGMLTYAGSTTKDNITTTIVGSGRCEKASTDASICRKIGSLPCRNLMGIQRRLLSWRNRHLAGWATASFCGCRIKLTSKLTMANL
jgi:hypothetical protein